MAECYITGKKTITGNKRAHCLLASRRTWKANLQNVKIVEADGTIKHVKVSARALKKANFTRA